MEPVGLAVGAIGLLGLFGSCMDALEKIDSYKEFGNDSRCLSTQFKAEKIRLQNWGAAVGLRDDSLLDDHHQLLDDPQILSTVRELLLIITNIGREDAVPFQSKLAGKDRKDCHTPTLTAPMESRAKKIRWALTEKVKRVEQVQRLASLVQSLYNLVPAGDTGGFGNYSSMNMGSSLLEVQELLARMEKELKVDEQREIHTWLRGKHSPNDVYEVSKQNRLMGTCDWILTRAEFQNWVSNDFEPRASKLLWVNGPAGFGKTILCSRILEHLRSNLRTPVAHFFFSSDFESREDPFAAIQSWISQLMSTSAALAIVRKKWALSFQPPTRSILIELFQELVHSIPHCTFVVDGLDECASLTSELTYKEHPVVDFLSSVKDTIAHTESRVLVVSRDERDIRSILETSNLSEYKITEEDVQLDTVTYSRQLINKKLPKKSDATKDEISLKMLERCQGQFLWLKMQAKDLRGGKNKKQLLDTINQTPSGLEHLYDRNWEKIHASKEAERERAISILRWAAFAIRPLTVREITEAVLIYNNDESILLEEMPEPMDEEYVKTEIIDICASLVEVRHTGSDSDSDIGLHTLHLTHHSVKQYLVTRMLRNGGSMNVHILTEIYQNSVLAKLCLQYVNMPAIWKEPAGVIGFFRQYAGSSWYRHVHAAASGDSEITSLMSLLFDEKNPVWGLWRRFFDLQSHERRYIEKQATDPLYYASCLGLVDAVQRIMQRTNGLIARPDSTGAALRAAPAEGYLDVVGFLLKNGVNESSQNRQGQTSLLLAAQNGHLEIVKLLLGGGADITVPCSDGWTPVHGASYGGHLEVVKLLLENGADITVLNGDGWTPVNEASYEGHLEVVKLLLENGADITVPSSNGWTLVNGASYKGHLEVVKLLLENGADITVPNGDGRTPVNEASYEGHLEVVKLLLENGADITVLSRNGWTPVNEASNEGHLEVVKLLLENGADITVPSSNGWTPVHGASNGGHLEVVKLLLENGADITISTYKGWTPLHAAVAHKHFEVAKLLIEQGADINSMDNYGWTPIYEACRQGQLDVVKLLLKNGADISVPNNTGETPFIMAARHGHVLIVELLLQNEQSCCAYQDNNGRTALFHAAMCGQKATVQLLAELDATGLHILDRYDLMPLYTAVRNGHEEVTEYLLMTQKPSTGIPTFFGKSLDLWASESGHIRICDLIRQYAQVTETKDPNGTLPENFPVVYNELAAWCDICTICIPEGDIYYVCTTCSGGNFWICLECDKMDRKCHDQSHTWSRSAE
ncbi:hypothetical protein QQS21_004470 [Conoideocrella luteorostrata]|uniref:Ankyrin n=1 Tax=Conoideocrella luteorostrata TaxID=1105319 RepID=A0AAJ0CRA1_9HYPO|nr:hypothetical protein QQS21_004470 [Conoideocrella luteorostrata]